MGRGIVNIYCDFDATTALTQVSIQPQRPPKRAFPLLDTHDCETYTATLAFETILVFPSDIRASIAWVLSIFGEIVNA